MNPPASQAVPHLAAHVVPGTPPHLSPLAGSHEVNHIHFAQDARRLRLLCNVPSASLAAIKKAGVARVFRGADQDAQKGPSFEARLELAEPRIDPQNGTVAVWMDLGEQSAALLPGEYCTAVFTPR